jgi:alpha/beta superfamily hydrolase
MKYQSIPGPAGALQVLEEKTVPEADAVAVICHPHPLHGGALANKVVHQLAKTFNEMGAVSVRFNFRGVGESEGAFDEGLGELEDLVAIARWARERWQGLPLWLAGFSFGGFIALQGAQRLEPRRLVTVAPAVNHFPAESFHLSGLDWLLIQGDAADIVPAVQVRKWLESQKYQPQLVLGLASKLIHILERRSIPQGTLSRLTAIHLVTPNCVVRRLNRLAIRAPLALLDVHLDAPKCKLISTRALNGRRRPFFSWPLECVATGAYRCVLTRSEALEVFHEAEDFFRGIESFGNYVIVDRAGPVGG